MVRRIKVKTVVLLDNGEGHFSDRFENEIERRFDCEMHGNDLGEAVISIASLSVSDTVKEIVEKDKLSVSK